MNPFRPSLIALSLAVVGLLAAFPARSAAESRAERREREAEELAARAVGRLAQHSFEGRRAAIADLERATELRPDEPSYQLLLARVYYTAGFVRAARQRFSIVAALDPSDAAAQFGLGQVWRRDWLKYVDTLSLARAADHFESSGRLDSTRVDAWLMATSMRLEMHDPVAAAAAARHALEADPRSVDAALAVAVAAWRLGDVEGAARDFRDAVPRLPRSVRERFEDIAPLATEQDTAVYNHLPAPERSEFARRFWAEQDPDPVTPENEAQLEYWSRVAQAYFLFWDPKHREWDERGEVYVRYGPPEHADFNPLGVPLTHTIGDVGVAFPMNVMVWGYPELGMVVTLQDRVLSEYYQLPMTRDYDPDPRPDPERLAALDAVSTHDSRGVFPALPPRSTPVHVDGQVARFEGEDGPRLLATLQAASTPGDSLLAHAVVLDSLGHEVRRATDVLSPSACEADRFRVAEFTQDLPPGRYVVGMEVRSGRRRGAVRVPVEIAAPDTELSLSDIVVTCGVSPSDGRSVRIDPNPGAIVKPGDPLTAYFEIYHLATGAGGRARFEYDYLVKSAERDPRIWIQRALAPRHGPAELQASWAEDNIGPLRRQFVSVPVQGLAAGRYVLEIRVRDLRTGREVDRQAPFARLAP